MKRASAKFALCLDNSGNQASLIPGKVYRVLPDPVAARDALIRIIDESGEDYLFAKSQFEIVEFPQTVRRRLLALQKAG